MSYLSNIATKNNNLFNIDVLSEQVTDKHRLMAKKIKSRLGDVFELDESTLSLKLEEEIEDLIIKPILIDLGFSYTLRHKNEAGKKPDFWLFNTNPDKANIKPCEYPYENISVLEAKRYNVDIDKQGIGSSEDQIIGYINENVKLNRNRNFGVLTNGRVWKIYYLNNGVVKSYSIDIFYAAKLSIHELEIFTLLFSPSSFLIKNNSTMLCELHNKSLLVWTAISDELDIRSNEIILNLIQGNYEMSLDLDISKSESYDFLYRMLFVLYIESKLFPTYGITETLQGIVNSAHVDDLDGDGFELSDNVFNLLCEYNKGRERFGKVLLIPMFGGEFFEDISKFKIKNKYLKQVLNLLAVYKINGSDLFFLDYSALAVETIGNIYESLLGQVYSVVNDIVTIEKENKKTGTEKHSEGAVYTPHEIVHHLISNVFDDKDLTSDTTICDIACGSGHFLVEGLRYLSNDIELSNGVDFIDHKRAICLGSIYGVDKNEYASKLSRLMLSIETAKVGEVCLDLRGNIKSFDSLLVKWNETPNKWMSHFKSLDDKDGFDFIIGNPPYVRADEPNVKDYRSEIKKIKQYKCLKSGKWDLFVPFIELALGLTKETRGSVSFVVGSGITYTNYAESITDVLRNDKHIKMVSQFKEPFETWAFPATCFIHDFSRTFKSPTYQYHSNTTKGINCLHFNKNPFTPINKVIVNKIKNNWKACDGLTLQDIAYVSVGMVLNSKEKKAEVAKFKKNDLWKYQQSSTVEHPVRYIDNKDLDFFKISDGFKKYIEYGNDSRVPTHVRRATFPELHCGPRVIISRSKNERKAVYVDSDIIVSDNNRIIKRWCDLKGVENNSIDDKIIEYGKNIGIKFPKIPPSGVNYMKNKKDASSVRLKINGLRNTLEELSSFIPYDLIESILNSDFYISWVQADMKDMHNVMPSVLSEIPAPLFKPINSSLVDITHQEYRKSDFGISFQSTLEKLTKSSGDNQILIILYLQDLVLKIKNNTSNNQLYKNYLDELIYLLYRPLELACSVTLKDLKVAS